MSNLTKINFFIVSGAAVLLAGMLISNRPKGKALGPKINGVSLVAPARPVRQKALLPVKKLNANWIVVTPYAFSRAGKAKITFNHKRQWWGERTEGVAQTIIYAKELGLHVMLKPHVWVRGEGWTGDFSLRNEAQWKRWEKDYSNYITHFARLADSLDVELLCIGTEYRKPADQRPEFWRQLIINVRNVFGGKLTYASNWDNYDKISFWNALDYIGIDAYFPLSEHRTPTVVQLKEKWQPIKRNLSRLSHHQNKPILFTEYGYESVNYTAAGHWKFERGERASNMQAQANAYRALFETFWDEPWFAGGYIWKWRVQHSGYRRNQAKGYTPQGKPAEAVIRQWYGRSIEQD